MDLHIPKIQLATLSEKEWTIYNNLNDEPYGQNLAIEVAEKLLLGKGLYHAHRDYCGLGLFFFENRYTLGTVYDGYDTPYEVIATYQTDTDLTDWLSKENDQSMALFGERFNNQTLTKIRLEWFLEDDYSPVWNDYCQYIRKRNFS